MPPRLYVTTDDLSRKWLTTMADREGVGLNTEQLTTRMSMSEGDSDVAARASATTEKMTASASARAAARPVFQGGGACRAERVWGVGVACVGGVGVGRRVCRGGGGCWGPGGARRSAGSPRLARPHVPGHPTTRRAPPPSTSVSPSGMYASSPTPLFSRILPMNARDSAVYSWHPSIAALNTLQGTCGMRWGGGSLGRGSAGSPGPLPPFEAGIQRAAAQGRGRAPPTAWPPHPTAPACMDTCWRRGGGTPQSRAERRGGDARGPTSRRLRSGKRRQG